MSKSKIPPNMINAKVSLHIQNIGLSIVGEVGGVGERWVPPPYLVQFSWFPRVMGCPPPCNILKYAPHTVWVNCSHQRVSTYCPIVCIGLGCTKFLPCPLKKLFAILYKIIGKLSLSTCFTNFIVGTPCFALWQCFIIRYRSANFQ